jgi:hypothetical protein
MEEKIQLVQRSDAPTSTFHLLQQLRNPHGLHNKIAAVASSQQVNQQRLLAWYQQRYFSRLQAMPIKQQHNKWHAKKLTHSAKNTVPQPQQMRDKLSPSFILWQYPSYIKLLMLTSPHKLQWTHACKLLGQLARLLLHITHPSIALKVSLALTIADYGYRRLQQSKAMNVTAENQHLAQPNYIAFSETTSHLPMAALSLSQVPNKPVQRASTTLLEEMPRYRVFAHSVPSA